MARRFNFRRVKVQANSLQVSPGEIAQESTAVRVAGPALTWLRDTRDSVLDAHRGTYTSFQEFLSNKVFGAQAVAQRFSPLLVMPSQLVSPCVPGVPRGLCAFWIGTHLVRN